jgi:hypothetical protein
MKPVMLSICAALALASCNQSNPPVATGSHTLIVQSQPGYSLQAGTLVRTDLVTGDTSTVITATGLLPNTAYSAEYHAVGPNVGVAACLSGGAVIGNAGTSSEIGGQAVTTDSSGVLSLQGAESTAGLATAAYVTLHEAASPAITPLCADLSTSN